MRQAQSSGTRAAGQERPQSGARHCALDMVITHQMVDNLLKLRQFSEMPTIQYLELANGSARVAVGRFRSSFFPGTSIRRYVIDANPTVAKKKPTRKNPLS